MNLVATTAAALITPGFQTLAGCEFDCDRRSQFIATFRSQFTMYLGSNFDRTDRPDRPTVDIVSRSCHARVTPPLGRDVRGAGGRKGRFGGLLIELHRLAMFPAPEEAST